MNYRPNGIVCIRPKKRYEAGTLIWNVSLKKKYTLMYVTYFLFAIPVSMGEQVELFGTLSYPLSWVQRANKT